MEGKNYTMLKKITDLMRRVPKWGYVVAIVYFALQYGLYRLGNFLSVQIGTINYAFECYTNNIGAAKSTAFN